MRHRIFIAINLPQEIKKELTKFQFKWPELPARWIKPENLHITLAFLGYLSDEEVARVCQITNEVAKRHSPFSINLVKISYGPPNKKPPRMVWVIGEKSNTLANLKSDLENELSGRVGFQPENRAFTPHITLARIRKWEFREIEREDRPEINEDISLTFEVSSIEVMESFLKRGGAEYAVLESAPLGQVDNLTT
jgi:2'-5' RNA ligase